ncbi:hypothetical protein NLJ89_g8760 [Agrocybe chaxingu]|uniref:Uncharacterized protein n=1 Tax=Agrocybe chaxingu TaxID=84603 RepID=A0A9W8JU21_9AGAR|nr:hypothetical protein NLJ89_g8760 [Agrocybe chaxingu]
MKEPTPFTYRMRFTQEYNSPFRKVQRVERDTTPVRTQAFPIYGALKQVPKVTRRRSSVDIVPVYRWCYSVSPVEKRPAAANAFDSVEDTPTSPGHSGANLDMGDSALASEVRATDIGEDLPTSGAATSPVSTPPTVRTNSDQTSTNVSPALLEAIAPEQPSIASPSHPVGIELQADGANTSTVVLHGSASVGGRNRHKIRDLDAWVKWFPSTGGCQLHQPLPCEDQVEHGDLYVHKWAAGTQLWMWNANGQWENVEIGHPHPTLPRHRLLLLATGEPRWVTKKTQTTYKSRKA